MSSGRHQKPTNRSKSTTTQANKSKSNQAKPFREKRHKRPQGEAPKPGGLHPRNAHLGRYDFDKLEKANPHLTQFVTLNPRGEKTVIFSDPQAVLALNEALLKAYYGLDFWQIPQGYLCPPIPGRVDYIHYLADLLNDTLDSLPTLIDNDTELTPKGSANHKHSVLDIGTGANCIYPLLGSTSYDWNFVGSDIDPISVKTAQLLVKANRKVKDKIRLRLQSDQNQIFKGIIKPQDHFALTMCNPPFHESMEKATQGSLRKVHNLGKTCTNKAIKPDGKPVLNFAGTKNELYFQGGEIAFLKLMFLESQQVADQVCWFTSLVSKQENVPLLKKELQRLRAKRVKIVHMSQGHKMTRFIAWTFLSSEEQAEFFNAR